MGVKQLKQALNDCIINFDRKVLVTDLLQDYEMAYAEVDNILKEYINEEEKKGTKFEKRFLVSGEEKDTENEIYTVVESENKVNDWLRKLKNVESALYSVEVAGGAKTPADMFKPMKWCAIQLENVGTREKLKWGATTNVSNTKAEVKAAHKKPNIIDFNAKEPASSVPSKQATKSALQKETKKSPTAVHMKTSPKEKQTTPEEHKSNAAKSNSKKGIANFFGPGKSVDKNKKATAVVKPLTPKKMQNFFKKTDKPMSITKAVKEEKITNTSVQLFSEDDDDNKTSETDQDVEMKDSVDVDTSDDEAKLEAIRRVCSEKSEIDTSASSSINKKRRRIIDSDDDDVDSDAPQVKHEKKDEVEQKETIDDEPDNKSETFLDEDGFVITIKAKKPVATKKPVKTASPKKSSPKNTAAKKSPKTTPKQAAKTKQGNIMSFFSKK